MSQNVAPWLEGLDEEDVWEAPAAYYRQTVSSATHDAHSITTNSTRIARRTISGTTSSVKAPSGTSTQKRRNPLATLSNGTFNRDTSRRPSTKLTQSRSFSGVSDTSVVQYDTVQQRSKSASPVKKETLEWKRRLVKGQVGYGDQTDLFGPSGLENIFAQSRPAEPPPRKVRGNVAWLQNSVGASMPSSPPPWPTQEPYQEEEEEEEEEEERLVHVDEEPSSEDEAEGSFRSNPFDLRHSEEPYLSHNEHSDHISPRINREEDSSAKNEGNRTVSGQTDVDDFSPVFISKQTNLTGQVEYKALDSRAVKQFQKSTVDLRHPSQQPPEQTSPRTTSETGGMAAEHADFTDGPDSESLPAVADLSLSENLPTGTPPIVALSHRVQLKRGGYSAVGSFKERPLSASQSTAGPGQEPSSLLSPSSAAGPNKSLAFKREPSTPSQERSEPRSRSSGSPLKLFGPHDTFTSNRLLRRMSQLDPDLSQVSSQGTSEVRRQQDGKVPRAQRTASGNSFGSGELNKHGFNAEITITSASDSDKDDSDRSPGSEVSPPGRKTPAGFRLEDFPVEHDTFRLKRKSSDHNEPPSRDATQHAAPKHLQPTVEDVPDTSVISAASAPGKRPPNSPFKAPTPKRRRTLHASELENDVSEANRSYHEQLQDALSNLKRRDSRRGDEQAIADPAVLSQRKILRPRNPTPGSQRQARVEAEIREATELFAEQEPEALEAVMEQIESSMTSSTPPSVRQQANVVAGEVAKFSLRVQKASGDHTERKRSVTTQDFFNEAVMVMRLIREKAGRQSGLGSVAESDHEMHGESAVDLDRSSLRVSRPPSREGVSGWRPRTSHPTDARVISHLRRFQEKDDTEFIARSVASLHVDGEDSEDNQVVAVDERSNIRIKGPLSAREIDAEDDPSRPSTQHSQQSSLASQSTQNSAASSTGRTILSRKSDNVGTLAPDAVAHLIGEQVGAMTYDKDKQQWVKAKHSPQKPQHSSFLEPPSNITSDDDPFREISDLPVDEHKEEEIRKASSERRPSTKPVAVDHIRAESQRLVTGEQVESRVTSQETVLARPVTRDSDQTRHTYSSSDPSRYTGLASSQQQTNETRATSWGDEELQRAAAQGMSKQQPLAYAAAQAAIALAGRNDGADSANQHLTRHTTATRAEACDIGFTRNEELDPDEEAEGVKETFDESNDNLSALPDDTAVGADDSDIEDIESPKLRPPPITTRTSTQKSEYRGAARQMSLRQKTLTSKFNDSEIMEQSEVSIVAPLPGDRMMSVSLSVSRPLGKRQPVGHVADIPSSPTKCDPSFMLSELPDFTVHEDDVERPSERSLAQRLARYAATEVDDRFALNIKDLVKTLTDVKEDDPYWEDLKQLDLHNHSLASIYGLEQFCGNVQEMNVSGNKLAYLNGAPSTVRQLVARSNRLSSLTSWTHLVNLQYLDISGNQLHNLDGLSCLYHLRELRADDNEICDIEGIIQLDGLLNLRLRRNKLRHVDFSVAQLGRLQELDLSANGTASIRGLQRLASLRTLRLDGNKMKDLLSVEQAMEQLKHLSIKNCGLRRLSVANMPFLRTLLADGNALSSIEGLEHTRSLDMLSMRQQSLDEGEEITVLDQPVSARTIRLSGNSIPYLHLPRSLLSLQHLELASTGLQELPDDFGLRLPNLSTLNLNYNSLKDIRPLLNIQKLEQFSVCNNRIDRLRKTIATISRLSTLTTLDLRDNPLTQGYYAPHTCTLAQTSIVRRSQTKNDSGDEDQQAEELEVAKYTFASGDPEDDRLHHSRMDNDLKLRRRVYHLLLGNSCPALAKVDGLAFDKTSAMVRDRTWERLLELGIVRKSGAMGIKGDEVTPR